MKTPTPTLLLKTELQEERANRDAAILAEYERLTAIEGQSKTQVNRYLMDKFGIHSSGTIYVILKRARAERELTQQAM